MALRFLAALFLSQVASLVAGEDPPKPSATKPNQTVHYVSVTASAHKPDLNGQQTVTIKLDIDPKIYLFANSPGNDDVFELAKTRLEFMVEGRNIQSEVHYPAGQKHKVGDLELRIYQARVMISATVHRQPGDSRPLEVVTRVQGNQFVYRF